MKRFFVALSGWIIGMAPALAVAEEGGGYSRGNAILYFSVIAVILIYGIHDVFRKKWLTWASVVVIPVILYLNLPAK